LKRGGVASPEDLIAHCREEIAGYKKPRAVVIVDHLPKNNSGKLDKAEMRRDFMARNFANGDAGENSVLARYS
jgi:acyl-CoA synthetase (AMP-forming)/AMP-acid ligase II